ncbi:2-amino-4-hydroxy-6-hydroxymethyldihydropteridine diphosphokinase [Desulfovibrio sp. SGI.169]|uniref:2-amino-4-hydroxy-6- hydroxymethyldihydropteridine diphosphokinase n=1 Tax=Desulfovibrio sp. SGI.169 TaxID=3420561 RepID=UPI003CFD0C01
MSSQADIQAFVGLGSNCSDAENMLARAREGLSRLPDARLGAASPLYSTEPQGYAHQPWFLNQVVELLLAPFWRPQSLLAAMLHLESSLGRVRSPDPALRYGPRVIDADLLLFGEECCSDPACRVPHPRLVQRAFALVPLLDIAPHVLIDGVDAARWLARLDYRLDGRRIFQ